MARPQKAGLDYFTLDCNFDDKLELIIAEFGMTGLGIIIRLFQKIYGSDGYYCKWNDDVALLFSRNCGAGGSVVSEVVKVCLRRGVFDNTLYKKHSILTSKGIQKRYFEAIKRRKVVEIKNEYLLIDISSIGVNVDINPINVDINHENVCNNAIKESRVKKSKVNKSKYGTFKNVLLTDEEHSKLHELKNGDEAIDFLSTYIAEKGYKSKSHYLAIKRWVLEAVAERQRKMPQKPKSSSTFDLERIKNDMKNNTEFKF